MSANNQQQEFFDALRSFAPEYGDPSALALTVARMIAAARLVPFAQENAPGFLDSSHELTKASWLAIVDALARKHRGTTEDRSINPFDDPPEKLPRAPGGLELLRRLILRAMSDGSSTSPIPTWLVHRTLELSDPHDLLGRIAKGGDSRLRDLIVEAVGATAKTRAFCAYDGAAGVAFELAAQGADVTLDIQQADLAAVCGCLALGAEFRLRVRQGDPLELARSDSGTSLLEGATYDTAVVFPPFGTRYAPKSDDGLQTGLIGAVTIEAAGVSLALARGSRLALCVLPPSFLFQTTKIDQIFKEQLIQSYGLDTVVGLPRGVFGGSLTAAALLVFKPPGNRRRSSDVFMIDARGIWDRAALETIRSHHLAHMIADHELTDISLPVPIDELAANDFNLSVERYVLDPEARRMRELTASAITVSLEDIAEFYRPQAIPSANRAAATSEIGLVAEVGVADIDEAGLVRFPGKQLTVTPDVALQARRARLETGDVLLVIKGSVGKVGFIREIPQGVTWLASQSFVILRLRQHSPLIDPRVLFRFLTSSLGQASIQSFRVGAYVPGLQMADVRRLPIIVPDRKTQELITHEVDGLFGLQDQIQKLRAELTDKQARIWPGNLGSPPQETAHDTRMPRKPSPSGKKAS